MTTNTKPFWEDGLEDFKYDSYSHRDDDHIRCETTYSGRGKKKCNCGASDSWNKLKEFVAYVESQTLLNAQKTIRELKDGTGETEYWEIYRKGVDDAANSLTPKI